jgi:hypothetical protein
MALQYSLKLSIVMLPALGFLLRIALAIPDLLCLYMYFRTYFSILLKNVIGILIWNGLNLKIAFSSMTFANNTFLKN